MALIVYGYTPVNGDPLSTTGWNSDIWSTTNGVSVYGELNGHVQDANFTAGVQLYPRHIRPYEGFRSEFSGAMETLDFHDLLFGASVQESDWIPVPGASHRTYIPFGTVLISRVSAFATNFRMRLGPASGQEAVTAGPESYVAMFVDGALVTNSIRRLPMTYWPLSNPGDADYLVQTENMLSHHFDFFALTGTVTAGWHDVDLRVLIVQNTGTEQLFPLYDSDATAKCAHTVTHRIRIGIRSASILSLV